MVEDFTPIPRCIGELDRKLQRDCRKLLWTLTNSKKGRWI